MNFNVSEFYADWQIILPECFLIVWALGMIAAAVFSNRKEGNRSGTFAVWALIGTVITAAWVAFLQDGSAFGGTFVLDRFAVFFKEIVLIALVLTVIAAIETVGRFQAHRGEFYGMLLLSAVGMMLMVSSTELLTLFVAIELSTIALMVLAAYRKTSRKSSEAGLKYVLLGAISSAVLLYGMALLYGMTGSTELTVIKQTLTGMYMSQGGFSTGMVLALLLLIAGFGFKLALAPFHMWAPDVYEGAPTPITAFLSVGSKAAALAAFVRVFFVGLEAPQMIWVQAIAALAALAMIVGNLTAIVQTNIKRMLAYSSVAQIGYILIGAVARDVWGTSAMAYYALAYLFANMGAFICVIAFSDRTGSDEIADYKGLARRSPALAAMFSLFLLSLTGLPPTAGFLAKYYVFAAAIKAGHFWIVLVGLLTSVAALYYYAGIIRKMYFSDEQVEGDLSVSPSLKIALGICAVGVIVLGVFPGPFIEWVKNAADQLFTGL